MAFVVELSESHLSVGPIHRTLSGIPDEIDIPALFGRWFDTVHAGPTDEHLLDAVGESGALALVTAGDIWLLTPQEQAYVESGSDLDSSLVAPAIAALPEVTTTYVHDWRAAVAAVTDGRAQAALLLRPVTVEQIADWAHARQRMPPKSTYFHPKPRTGMVFRVLED
jgi:hypothetical protein